jgi:hypothetical protein
MKSMLVILSMAVLTVMVLIISIIKDTRATLSMAYGKVKEFSTIIIMIYIRAISNNIRKLAKESSFMQMVTSMTVIL